MARSNNPNYSRFQNVFLETFITLWTNHIRFQEKVFIDENYAAELAAEAKELLAGHNQSEDDFAQFQNEVLSNLPSEYDTLQPTIGIQDLQRLLVCEFDRIYQGEVYNNLSEAKKLSLKEMSSRLSTNYTLEHGILDGSKNAYIKFLDEIFIRAINEPPKPTFEKLFLSEKDYKDFIDKLISLGWIDNRLHWSKHFRIFMSPLLQFLANTKILSVDSKHKIAVCFCQTFVTDTNAESLRKILPAKSSRYKMVAEHFSFLVTS